ncbi:hypothetical protein E4U21_005248, partial [Claviceps maximensis]
MASANDNLPEVAHGASYPEAHQHQVQYQPTHHQPNESSWSPNHSTAADSTDPSQYLHLVKTENYQSYPQVVAGSPMTGHGHGPDANYYGRADGRGGGRTMLGCAPVVFFLSVTVAVMGALVISLAAGTGIAASNYRAEQSRFRDLQASYSALASASRTAGAGGAGATGTPSYSKISNGCSDENESTTGTFYRPD